VWVPCDQINCEASAIISEVTPSNHNSDPEHYLLLHKRNPVQKKPQQILILTTFGLPAHYEPQSCFLLLIFDLLHWESANWCNYISKCEEYKLKQSRYRPEQALRLDRGIALPFPDLGARRWWVVSTTPRPLYPWERHGTHCTEGWVGPRAGLDLCEKSRPHRDFFYYSKSKLQNVVLLLYSLYKPLQETQSYAVP
jgi:hypothetical protein